MSKVYEIYIYIYKVQRTSYFWALWLSNMFIRWISQLPGSFQIHRVRPCLVGIVNASFYKTKPMLNIVYIYTHKLYMYIIIYDVFVNLISLSDTGIDRKIAYLIYIYIYIGRDVRYTDVLQSCQQFVQKKLETAVLNGRNTFYPAVLYIAWLCMRN